MRALVGAGAAAVERPIRTVRNRYQVIGTERFAAPVAVELIAAGTKQGGAVGLGAGRLGNRDVPGAVFVVVYRDAVEIRVATGAGGGSDFRSHGQKYSLALSYMSRKIDALLQKE